jgi:hypothetical protein
LPIANCRGVEKIGNWQLAIGNDLEVLRRQWQLDRYGRALSHAATHIDCTTMIANDLINN